MKLLDLFCGVGLAADGYTQAGFEVTGVDIHPQSNYPYTFIQADAMEVMRDMSFVEQFDVIHASPPCQAHTRAQHLRKAQGGTSKYPDLLTPTLQHVASALSEYVWVVENVPGAPGMDGAVIECGSAYGLGVRRHRLFLSNAALIGSGCDHKSQGRPWGVYHVPGDSIPRGGRTARNVEHGREVMGVERQVSWNELKEGFPPAYTRHIGVQIVELLDA